MSVLVISNADNREEWLETRKRYLTASSIYAWRGPACADKKNAWYFENTNRDTILAEKLNDAQPEFGPYATVSMAHGSQDEVNILEKLGLALNAEVEPTNRMFVNDRWPHLAATIDGVMDTPQALAPGEELPYFCQDREGQHALHDALRELEGPFVTEAKKSVSVGWARNQPPEYYICQVQTQLAILEWDYGVLVAECLFTDPKEKWRKYWDLRPFLVARDPNWDRVLDKCEKEFAIAMA